MPYIYYHKYYCTTNTDAVLLFFFPVIYEFTFLPKNTSMRVYRSNCNMPCRHRWGVHIQLCSYLFGATYWCTGNTMPQLCKYRGSDFAFFSGTILSTYSCRSVPPASEHPYHTNVTASFCFQIT